MNKLLKLICLVGVSAGLSFPLTAFSDAYPSKVVKIVVGVPPGTAGDTAARIVADALTRRLKQPFIVDNKPGANGAIAATTVASAAGDGYSLFLSASSPLTITPHLVRKLSWNPLTSFEPIVEVGNAPLAVITARDSRINSLRDLLQQAKMKPDHLNAGILPLSMSQIALSMFQAASGARFHAVPYKGATEMTTAIISGELDIGVVGLAGLSGQLGPGGMLKAIALTSATRSSVHPGVPTIGESLTGYDAGSWFGLLGPAGMEATAVAKLNAAVNDILKEKSVAQQLEELGTIPTGGEPQALREHLQGDHARFGAVIKSLGLTPQ